jgi:tetratricopeptide (TPR) repeat protein
LFGLKKKRIEFDDLPEKVQEELEMVEIRMMEGEDPVPIFQRISKKYPGFLPARLNLASTLLDAGNIENAKSTYQKILKEYPEEFGAVAGLATIFDTERNHDEAERLANKAIQGGYNWPPCYEVIAKAQEARGETGNAANTYLSGYKISPHSWVYLEKYCKLTDQEFKAPTESFDPNISLGQLESLICSIEKYANSPDENGAIQGCDHSFRFTEKWAENNNVNIINLYQFLNAHGGFCDCEVCFNVSELLDDNIEE